MNKSPFFFLGGVADLQSTKRGKHVGYMLKGKREYQNVSLWPFMGHVLADSPGKLQLSSTHQLACLPVQASKFACACFDTLPCV